jgi:hypothetical protein
MKGINDGFRDKNIEFSEVLSFRDNFSNQNPLFSNLLWLSDRIEFQKGFIDLEFVSSLFLDTDKQDDNQLSFLFRKELDSILYINSSESLPRSSLRFLEEVDERDISGNGSFPRNSLYSQSLFSSWNLIHNEDNEMKIESPSVDEQIQLLITPTPLSLPSKHLITESIYNGKFEVKSMFR